MRTAAEKGKWPFKAPLGYMRISNGTISMVPDPDRATLIAQAFEMIGSGATLTEALRKITLLGLRAASGKPVNKQSFSYTLRKPVYTGWITSQH